MKSFPELITTTLNLGGNAFLKVFDRTPNMPDNDSRRRELESMSGLYGDDLLQNIDVYAIQSYRVLNEEIDRIWQDIHHEVATIHPTLRKRLQALSGAVGDLTQRVHSHSVAKLKIQQSIEESYIEFDSLAELSEKIAMLESQIQGKEQERLKARAHIQKGFNNLLDGITSNSKITDDSFEQTQKSSKVASKDQKLFEKQASELEDIELNYDRLRLNFLKSVRHIRNNDKNLVDLRFDFEEQKAEQRPYGKWTLEKLEEQQLQLEQKLQDLHKQLKTLKSKYDESDRRSSMFRLEQETLEKELANYSATLASTEQELQLHHTEELLESKQKQFSTTVAKLRKHTEIIDQRLVVLIQKLALHIVDLYQKDNQDDQQDLADYLFSSAVSIYEIPQLKEAFTVLQKLESLRLRNQQHFLRMDIWLNDRKIKKLKKDLKEQKKLGANKGSFGAAIKEIEQDIEKRRAQVHDGLHRIFKTHLELLLDRHKQPKECIETSQFAFEKACVSRAVDFEDFAKAIVPVVNNSQFEKEQSAQDLTRRKAIVSCINTKRDVIRASKVLKSKHAEVLLVASETPNLMHSPDNLMKRRQKIQQCNRQLRSIEAEVCHLLNQ